MLQLPDGKRIAVALTFDFDRHSLPATWATSGHDLVTFPAQIERILAAGHEIAAHGCYHEVVSNLGPDEERRLLEVSLGQHKQIVGRRPVPLPVDGGFLAQGAWRGPA
jgi:peptidoglycan/xylan/chitin deacetylase (PgdA/CDA1 family)